MAYTAHPTVVTGQTWSAAQQNTYVRDNLAALWLYTTKGDIVYALTSSTLARLAVGGTGAILTVASGAPAWKAAGGNGSLLTLSGGVLTWLAAGVASSFLYTNSSAAPAWSGAGAGKYIRFRADGVPSFDTWPNGGIALSSTMMTNTGWDGDTKSVGTYNITATSFNAGIPDGVYGLLMTLSAAWASGTPDDGKYVNVVPYGLSDNCLLVRAHDDLFQDNTGFVGLIDGKFTVRVVGGAAIVYLNIWGYSYYSNS